MHRQGGESHPERALQRKIASYSGGNMAVGTAAVIPANPAADVSA